MTSLGRIHAVLAVQSRIIILLFDQASFVMDPRYRGDEQVPALS